MTQTHIVITVADPEKQDFSLLIDQLTGKYVPQDLVETYIDDTGKESERIVEHPYKNIFPRPDYYDKIHLVSHQEIDEVDGCHNVFVEGELCVGKLWNAGILNAKDMGAERVVILNQVSSINPYIFEEAVKESNVDVINLSDGGCFIVSTTVTADERFHYYFTDTLIFSNNQTEYLRFEFTEIVQENQVDLNGLIFSYIDEDMKLFELISSQQ